MFTETQANEFVELLDKLINNDIKLEKDSHLEYDQSCYSTSAIKLRLVELLTSSATASPSPTDVMTGLAIEDAKEDVDLEFAREFEKFTVRFRNRVARRYADQATHDAVVDHLMVTVKAMRAAAKR